MEEILRRLSEANIDLLPTLELTTHFVFTRDGFISLVERRGDQFGNIGAPGILCEKGMAQLIWRADSPFFVAKGFERPATTEEVSQLRQFAEDLKKSLTA